MKWKTGVHTKDNGKSPYLMSLDRHKKTNFKDGVGIMFWPDGTKYEGQFRNDKQHGKGRKIFSNGEFYIGNFANDKANGFGVFQDLNGGKYEGEWKEDK